MVLQAQEKLSVKADLAIYTHVFGVPESVALMLSHKMDLTCCAIRDGFRKSSHNCKFMYSTIIITAIVDFIST